MWKETDSDLNSCQRIQVSFFCVRYLSYMYSIGHTDPWMI